MVINFAKETEKLNHYWSNCVGAGRANEGLRADWQQHLKTVVDTCGFRYLRFHGLFHEDMHVYKEENGVPVYNFQYIDALFDAMLDTGIRPFIEFSFMPEPLASDDNRIFWWNSCACPPNDFNKWGELIRRVTEHWVSRYGVEEVRNWYFEVWNEPNINFWSGTRTQYFELYRVTANAVKGVDAQLRVGGPATSNFVPDTRFDGDREDFDAHITFKVDDLNTLSWHGAWIKEFLAFCEQENLPADFVSTHPYPTDFAFDTNGKISGRTRYKDSLKDDILWLKGVIAESAFPNAEIHLTEWSTSPSSRDYSHDYLPAAAYVMRSNLNCIGLVDSLSYWVFTDVFEELGAGPKAFHGGFGTITMQGVKKPTYHAYRMMEDLGDELLEKGEGYFFTKKGARLAANFYNYPDGYKDTVPMSIFPDQQIAIDCQRFEEDRAYSFRVEGLNPGDTYTLKTLCKEDIAVTLWNEMGAPTEPTREQAAKLREQGEVLRETVFTVDADGVLALDFSLNSWSIAELI